MPALDVPASKKGILEFKVNPAKLTKISGTEAQPLQLSAGRKTYKCRLGNVLYRVVVEPYIFNARVMGQCGAADPVISLSVSRNGKQLLSNLNFQNSCHTDKMIHRIQVFEREKSIKILALLDAQITIERTFSLTSFPKEWEEAIFEDYPTGDTNVDLFIAVNKRDIDAIQKAIRGGANPNATDVMGFPPLALLGNGRDVAYRNKTLTDFDHLSEEMAKVLFTAGASGLGANKNGVTLLEILIGKVPSTVIDMMFVHGANAREGFPLRNAVMFGDTKLVQKLMDKGAEPNKKGQDRTTVLYTASTSGFYSWLWGETTPITEYAKCIRLLLQNGAIVQDAIADQEGLLWLLVRGFGKDERLKIILKELIPYSDHESVERARKLATKLANENKDYSSLAKWLNEYVR